MLSARKLYIEWGNDTRYWDWIDHPDSRFKCALLTPNTLYAACLVFKLEDNAWGLGNPSQKTKVAFSCIESEHSVCLDHRARELNIRRRRRFLRRRYLGHWEVGVDVVRPQHRQDGWLEVELGEFNSGNGIDGEVDMSLLEIKGGYQKNGLIVQGIEVRPKH